MAARQKLLPDPEAEAIEEAAALEARYGRRGAREIIEVALDCFGDNIAAISSFGADSAALLHLVASVDASIPVIFLDTGKHFDETLDYRDRLAADLGLADLRMIGPRPELLAGIDPYGRLHETDTDACCGIRKVEPLARAVEPFAAWLTGRKRHQVSSRAAMLAFEAVGTKLRINPLAGWTTADQAAYMRAHDLRVNPLVAHGYLSIGCLPCTRPVEPGEDARSGRWAGEAKTECGIHLAGLERSLASSPL